jgi:hypothetical protein
MKTLFILIISPLMAFGQSNYMEYHRLINNADYYFGNEKFESALSMYDSAFQEFDAAFVWDYIMAAQISTLTSSSAHTSSYLEKALKAGYTCECVEQIPVLAEYIKTDEWDTLKSKKVEFRALYISKISPKLNMEFSERYKKEQEAKGPGSRVPFINEVKSNFARIKFLIDSLGFPSERNIGIDFGKNSFSTRNELSSCNAGNSKVIATLLNYDNPITDIGIEKFIEAIELGLLHPREFAYIFTFEKYNISRISTSLSVNVPVLPDYEFNFSLKLIDNKTKVNQDRARFGICPLETEEKVKLVEKKYSVIRHFHYS